jgi:hypothetical protein
VAGNVAQVPAAANAQVLSDSVGALGNAANETTSWTGNFAGGDTHTTGMFGAISGNLAQVPAVANAEVLDDAVGAGGLAFDKSSTSVINTAGGEADTSGVFGSVAGNLASVPLVADAQVTQDAVSAAGQAYHAGANKVVDLAGGDVKTNGTGGSISGDLLQVPAAAIAGVFTDAVTVGGISATKGVNVTDVASGGSQTTAGVTKKLSGLNGHLPIGALVQVFDVPVEVFGTALAHGANVTSAVVGEEKPALDLPITSRGLMGARELPSLPVLSALPTTAGLPLAGLGVDSLMGLTSLVPLGGALPGLPAQERDLPSLSGVLPTDNLIPGAHLAQLPALKGVQVQPNLAGGARALPGQELLGDLGSMTEGLHLG